MAVSRAMAEDVVHVSEESVIEVIERYRERGYEGQFAARPDEMVHCYSCKDDSPADQVPLEALHRFEGASDPGDEQVVAAMECPSCGALGTMSLPYGSGATGEDLAVLEHLMDDRRHSGIRTGT